MATLKPGAALRTPATATRVEWLDGVRALAALFVVVHHVWLLSVGGYPGNNGPWTMDWMVYGHLAVSVFIVVSGFSLTLSPARHEGRLPEGGLGFLRRRFWRIVPPYWAALAFSSVLVVVGLASTPTGGALTSRDVLVHGLLLQDAIGTTPPNGVFWSIAVEWHIYFLFPLVLLLVRRWGAAVVLGVATALVIAQHLIGAVIPAVGWFDRFSPAYFVLFVGGSVAAQLATRGAGASAGIVLGALCVAGFATAAGVAGPRTIVGEYFWVDLVVGAATACLFVALTQGRLPWLARFLALRPLAAVGTFAFSLYLVHAPILDVLRERVLAPAGVTGANAFWPLMLLGVPAALAGAYAFFVVCERPFLRIRSFRQLWDAVRQLAVPWRRTRAGGTP
ncbi:acyltransferase family protein [Sinomonas sp. P47F7]|uniref:acyltransferase family protein n=1 Tax=Sinomonas sp. P47F7 TaxID=3410987 RepID=UPI003BF5BD5A